jgi:hypothetical protein
MSRAHALACRAFGTMARPKLKKVLRARPLRRGAVGAVEAPIATEPGRPILRAWWQDDRTRFVLAFAALAGCMLAFYYFPRTDQDAVERRTAEYLRLYTRMVSWPIGIFDHGVSAHGNLVAGRFSMQIDDLDRERLTRARRSDAYPTTSNGRIISFAACSSRWQCHT